MTPIALTILKIAASGVCVAGIIRCAMQLYWNRQERKR